ncbi:Exonuclease GOR [Trichinella zimbabwensis]|uniref:Exonuclease GOR n=1 Tax=Trichinella zimbabwensis TaxID=268475 RepID=A0A0V1HGR4_9BILA|nr:Exonuclease GOR [Trichinella zimbabwensis]KRZ10002.1 Exonuclease GOR [Trichinella zimbabwensis]
MFPSNNRFGQFSCPFFLTGACNRPYCFFSHQESSKAVHKKTNSSAVNNSTTAYSNDNNCSSSASSAATAAVAVAYTPTPIAELKKRKEDREKRRKARQLENAKSCQTPCNVEIVDLTKSEATSSPVSSSSAAEQETTSPSPVARDLETCPSSASLLIIEEQPIAQLKRQPEEVVGDEISKNASNFSTSTPKKIRKVDLFGEDSDDDRLIAFCAVDEDEVEKSSVDETTDQLFQSLLAEKAKGYANVPSVDDDTVLESASVAYEKRKVALQKEASMIKQQYNNSSNIRWSAYKTSQLASTSHQPEAVEKAPVVQNDHGAMFSTLPADIKPEKTTLENNSVNAELAIKQLRSVKKENAQKLIRRPVIVPGSHLKIPFTVRQTILNYFIDAFLKQGATEEQALEKAQKEEEFLCKSCQHKMTYNVAAIHRLKRIKDGQLSIRSVSSYGAVDSQVLLDLFYNKLERFVLSLDDLQAHGFPLPDPENFTRAYFSKKEVAKTYLPVDGEKDYFFSISGNL